MKSINNKQVFMISAGVVLYFSLLFVNAYVTKINLPFLGVLQEIFTLPLLGLQVVMLIFVIQRVFKEPFAFRNYSFWSFILLASSSVMTIGAFFIDN